MSDKAEEGVIAGTTSTDDNDVNRPHGAAFPCIWVRRATNMTAWQKY